MAVRKTKNTPSPKDTKIDFMKAVNNIGQPLAILVGFAVGKVAINKLEKSQAVDGLMGPDFKGYIIPGVVTGGGLIGMQLTKNPYIKMGLASFAGAGVAAGVKRMSGKDMMAGLEGSEGDKPNQLPAYTQQLPSADIDIEAEIQNAVDGVEDFSMSDDPMAGVEDYSMSDDPIGKTSEQTYPEDDYDGYVAGDIDRIEPEKINEDADLFAGDMMPD